MGLVLGWGYVLLPLACWAALARTRVVGVVVAAVLAALAVIPVGLEYAWFHSRATAESQSGYPLAAGLVVLLGALAERRRYGPRPARGSGQPAAGATIAIAAHSLVGLVIGLLYQLAVHEPFSPDRSELSLPPGLAVAEDSGPDRSCGLHACRRDLLVVSTGGLSVTEAALRLRARLAADGWRPGPGPGESLVHRHGWLLDKRVTRLSLAERPAGVAVRLTGPDRFP
ncbi:hypothetical protein ABT093_10320 [Kitasatospora sp. NPDC002551]|uniref:hypothetical protein n=1 Tax=unclassified Kitasatospora TaxID=2633591 RepID=UPI00332EEA2F